MARSRMQSTSCFVNLIQLLIVVAGILLASSCQARATNQTDPPQLVPAGRLAVAIRSLRNDTLSASQAGSKAGLLNVVGTTTTKTPNRILISSSQAKNSTTPARGLNRLKSDEQRQTNSRRLDQDYGSDRQEQQQQQYETINGVVQVGRVARNVKRKLDQLSDRMSQIQSVIAQDHSGGDLSSDKPHRQARQEDDNADRSGETGAGGEAATTPPSNPNQQTNRQQQWSAASLQTDDDAQTNGDSGGGVAADQLVQEDQDQASGDTSNKHPSEQINSSSDSDYQVSSSTEHQTKAAPQRWSTPVIRSVIPGRSLDLVQDKPSDAPTNSNSDINDSDSYNNVDSGKNLDSQEASVNSLDSQTSLSGGGGGPSVGDSSLTLDQSDVGGNNSHKIGTSNSSTIGQRQQQQQQTPEPSMMHAEWSPNENYQYFSELNMKNHGAGQSAASGSDDLQRIASHRVASPPMPVASVGKFQNMTILNSDTDLANSYSMSGPQLSPMSPTSSSGGGASNSAPPTSTRRPSVESGDQSSRSQSEQQQPVQKKNSSVHTYSAANYGKSTRDQVKAAGAPTTGQQHYVSVMPSQADNWSQAQQLAPTNHQTSSTGVSGSDGAGGVSNEPNHKQRQSEENHGDDQERDHRDQQIRWPAMATPAPAPLVPSTTSYANTDNSDQIGLPPSVSNNLHANRYSSVMMPASLGAHEHRHRHHQSEHQQHQDRDQPSRRSHRTSDVNRRQHQQAFADQVSGPIASQNSGADDDSSRQTMDEPNESAMLSAHKYSVELPSEQSRSNGASGALDRTGNDDANNSRRRSLEARRQLTTTTDTTLYESQHQLQQPTQQSTIDTYSSRVDSVSPALTQFVDSSAMNVSATTVAPTLVSLPQDHLKHRSSSGSLSMDEQQLPGGNLYGSSSSSSSAGSNYPEPNESPTLSSSSSSQGLDGGQNYNHHQSGYYAQAGPYYGANYGLAAAATSDSGSLLPASSYRPSHFNQASGQLDSAGYYSAQGELPQTHLHHNQQQQQQHQQQNQQATDNSNQQQVGYPQSAYNPMRLNADQGQVDSDSTDERQQALMTQLDNMANGGAPSDVQQYGPAHHIARPSAAYAPSAYVGTQFYAPTSIQDTIQQATLGASNGNEAPTLARQQKQQQQLQREAQMSQTIADYNAYVRQYQQRQRALATQLALQQQQQQQQLAMTSGQSQSLRPLQVSPSIARSFYVPSVSNGGSASAGASDQQQAESATSGLAAAVQSSMLKRYSPETLLANYLTARSSQSGSGTDSPGASSYYYGQQQPSLSSSATLSSPQQAYYTTPTSYNTQSALRAALAQLAYQRLLAQVGAASTSSGSQHQHLLSSPSASSSYLANLQSSLASLAQQQQSATSSSSNSGGAGAGNMYATAAMPQPVFYEAPASFASGSASGPSGGQQVSQMVRASQDASTANYESPASSSARTTSAWSPLPVSSSSAGTGSSSASSANRRNYLTSLFKPSATSRYYYGPTILSPISLASPTALHAIYAPTSSASATTGQSTGGADPGTSAYGPGAALGHYYTNPYAFAAAAMAAQAAQPHLNYHHSAYQDPQSMAALAAQQYQQAMAAAAAAAAANSMQQHYLSGASGVTGTAAAQPSDTDMAESSMVPSDSAGSFASPPDGSSDSNGNDSSSPSSSSSKSSGGSMKQWLTVASLLAGILPMGLVMASMLPMLSVAGRKKRQLDFSASNFSDIYNSWQPSAILKAIMSASNESIGFANATRLLSELTAPSDKSARLTTPHRLNKSHQSESKSNSSKSARVLGLSTSSSSSAATASQVKQQQQQQQHHSQWASLPFIGPLLTGSGNNSTAVDSSAAKPVNLPLLRSTTPVPAPATGTSNGANHQTSAPAVPVLTLPHPIKTTMKKVYEKVNNFIVTAQKRKHRSSAMDSLWPAGTSPTSGPGGARSLPSLIKNMFDLNELKKYLAELLRAKLAAAHEQQSILDQLSGRIGTTNNVNNNGSPIDQQRQVLEAGTSQADAFASQQNLSNLEWPPIGDSSQQQLTSASSREGNDLDRTRYATVATTSNSTGTPMKSVLQQYEATTNGNAEHQEQSKSVGASDLKRFAQLSAQIHILPPAESNETNVQLQQNGVSTSGTSHEQLGMKQEAIQKSSIAQDSVVPSRQKMTNSTTKGASTSSLIKEIGTASKAALKRSSLMACLYKVLCDLATKLRKASGTANGTKSQGFQRNGTIAPGQPVQDVSPDEDKQMTGQILSQLIDHIQDADRDTMIFGNDLRDYQKRRQWRPSNKLQEDRRADSQPILMIQEAILKGQCSATFVCPDPYQFKRIFSELKWPKQ